MKSRVPLGIDGFWMGIQSILGKDNIIAHELPWIAHELPSNILEISR